MQSDTGASARSFGDDAAFYQHPDINGKFMDEVYPNKNRI
jgi:hypothetical protein